MFKNIDKVFNDNSGINDTSLAVVELYSGQVIKKITMDSEKITRDSEVLIITFESGSKIQIMDDGQSCCETRYMHCEDEADFEYLQGSVFRFIEVVDAPDEENEGAGEYDDVHEVQFCNILTSKGVIQLTCHNEHNGYYGGFGVEVKAV
jgi:hypothetical protein